MDEQDYIFITTLAGVRDALAVLHPLNQPGRIEEAKKLLTAELDELRAELAERRQRGTK